MALFRCLKHIEYSIFILLLKIPQIITSAKVEVMRLVLFVICSFCLEQDYCKSNQPISLKLDVMIGPINRKNWLTFGADPVVDTDCGSLFYFHHHCGIGDFRRFISISYTVTSCFSRHPAKWLMPTRWWIHNILAAVWQTSESESGLIQKSGFES